MRILDHSSEEFGEDNAHLYEADGKLRVIVNPSSVNSPPDGTFQLPARFRSGLKGLLGAKEGSWTAERIDVFLWPREFYYGSCACIGLGGVGLLALLECSRRKKKKRLEEKKVMYEEVYRRSVARFSAMGMPESRMSRRTIRTEARKSLIGATGGRKTQRVSYQATEMPRKSHRAGIESPPQRVSFQATEMPRNSTPRIQEEDNAQDDIFRIQEEDSILTRSTASRRQAEDSRGSTGSERSHH